MTRLRLLVLSTLLLVSAVLGGCKIDAVEPIVPLAAAQADPALYGVWRHREGDETTYVHIGPAIALGGPKEGLFGFTYQVVGPPGSPTLNVNPASGLVPGFLRKFFEYSSRCEPMKPVKKTGKNSEEAIRPAQ